MGEGTQGLSCLQGTFLSKSATLFAMQPAPNVFLLPHNGKGRIPIVELMYLRANFAKTKVLFDEIMGAEASLRRKCHEFLLESRSSLPHSCTVIYVSTRKMFFVFTPPKPLPASKRKQVKAEQQQQKHSKVNKKEVDLNC